jgi:hypothetical protein
LNGEIEETEKGKSLFWLQVLDQQRWMRLVDNDV